MRISLYYQRQIFDTLVTSCIGRYLLITFTVLATRTFLLHISSIFQATPLFQTLSILYCDMASKTTNRFHHPLLKPSQCRQFRSPFPLSPLTHMQTSKKTLFNHQLSKPQPQIPYLPTAYSTLPYRCSLIKSKIQNSTHILYPLPPSPSLPYPIAPFFKNLLNQTSCILFNLN